MRKIISLFVLAAVFCSSLPFASFGADNAYAGISAESYIVTDDFGREVFSYRANEKMYPASTAKLLTALVAVENCDLNREITVTAAHTATEGSMMYLREGERISLEDLLYGLLLASGNDAALSIAELVAGSPEDFAALMNTKAAELGMNSSRFSNPSGLPDENCYTTARDMARLIEAFCENEALLKISGTREAVLDGRTVVNHNRLLSTVSGVDGGKTGYTEAAGRCLVSTAERNGRRIFVVTLNAPDDWTDHKKLFDGAFERYAKTELGGFLPVSQDIVGGEATRARVQAASVPSVWLSPEEIEALQGLTYMRRFEYAGIEMGAACGRTDIYCGERLICQVGLYYAESIPAYGASLGF